MELPKVCELINEENGFLVKLRCNNEFNIDDYEKIKELLKLSINKWKENGNVPIDEVVAIMSLVDQLARGSRFFDDETALKVEDACIEIEDIINNLIF